LGGLRSSLQIKSQKQSF